MDKNSLKYKIFLLIVCPVITMILTQAVYSMPLKTGVIVSIVSEIVLAISLFFEKRSNDMYDKLQSSIESGEYGTDAEWRAKYEKFVDSKGFETVKNTSMRKDMHRRYTRYGMAFTMLAMAAATFVVCIVCADVADMMIFCTVVAIGFAAFGAYCLSAPNVRKFLSRCGDEYQLIENSYMNGRQLTYKKNFTENACNDGINIGGEYIVIFTKKEISALRVSDVIAASHRIFYLSNSLNSIYTGSEYLHFIDVTVRNPRSGFATMFSAQLSEFQAELACETINKLIHE